jgi:cytosine/adenosine deaminase-related metal-dependent hydrolase
MKILTANWVLPITSAPIPDGAAAIEADKIIAVGALDNLRANFPEATVEDYGAAAILPGFVNAHAHLELTVLRGYLDSVEDDFASWLFRLATARDGALSLEDIEASAVCGAIEAARAGITCIADIGKHAQAAVKALLETNLRGVCFQENSFALDPASADERFAEWREKVSFLRDFQTNLVKIGVTPHAPYTVSAPLFQKITRFAADENLPMTIHVAESRAEEDFMRHGGGKIGEMLSQFGINWRAPGVSSVKYLDSLGVLAAKPLIAHGVFLNDEDLAIISEKDARIAHCPKSNAKFAHGVAPLGAFLSHKIKTGLGSDSVASNNTFDFLEEARFAALIQRAAHNVFVSAEDVLKLATIGGAAALGMEKEIGSLEVGKQADIVVISLDALPQQPVYDPFAALIFASSARDVVLTIIAGREIYRNGAILTIDEAAWRAKLDEAAQKIKG